VKLLLKHGALPNLANSIGVTPLMVAAGDGHINDPTRGNTRTEDDALECYALLKAAGADVDARTTRGLADADLKIWMAGNRTALHAAASRGWNRLVSLLVKDGARLDVIDTTGCRPSTTRWVATRKCSMRCRPRRIRQRWSCCARWAPGSKSRSHVPPGTAQHRALVLPWSLRSPRFRRSSRTNLGVGGAAWIAQTRRTTSA
jgi:hypothetical protein